MEKYTVKQQSKRQAKGNPFYQWLSGGDQELLGEYADYIFSRVKQRYGCDDAMAVYISSSDVRSAVLRLWCLGGVGSGGADGNGHLDYYGGCLAGVAPEAPRVFGPCATYRDAPREAPAKAKKKSRTLWDVIRGR